MEFELYNTTEADYPDGPGCSAHPTQTPTATPTASPSGAPTPVPTSTPISSARVANWITVTANLAATDIGVFRSTDSGGSWAPFNLSVIPAVPVFDIEQSHIGTIFARTHGRGVFRLAEGVPTQTPTPAALELPHLRRREPAARRQL